MRLTGETDQLSDWENAKIWLSDPRVTRMSAKVLNENALYIVCHGLLILIMSKFTKLLRDI